MYLARHLSMMHDTLKFLQTYMYEALDMEVPGPASLGNVDKDS